MLNDRTAALATLAAAACVTLALGGVVSLLFAAGCFTFVLFKHLVLDRIRFHMPDLVFVLAHATLFVSFLVFAIFNQIDDLAVLLGFATLWMALRMFAEQTPYNDFLIVLSSLVIAVGSAAVAPGLLPVAITALYLAAMCYTMPVIMTGRDRDEGVTVRLIGRTGGWSVAAGFAVHHLSIGGLLLGAVVYLAVPRLRPDTPVDPGAADDAARLAAAREARRRPATPADAVTGFPSSVKIGDIGEIKRSDRRAFSVWIRRRGVAYDPRGSERSMLLLRADAWDTYDPARRAWTRWETSRYRLPSDGRISSGPAELHYKVRLHGYDGKKLFLPQRTRRVRSNHGPLYRDQHGRITADVRIPEYAVEADLPAMSKNALRGLRPASREVLTIVDDDTRRALMPYARAIGATPRPVPGHVFRVVNRIREYFEREAFRYTLRLPPLPEGKDPVIAFLERREGHCELYASAACLLLRMAGIPARIAGGVRCAERVAAGHYRAGFRNAHAWVEIACKDVGFVAFDFTPADSAAVQPRSEPAPSQGPDDPEAAGGGLDWSDPFRYGHEQQQRLVRAVRTTLGRYVMPGIGVLMALLIGVAVFRQLRGPGRDRVSVRPPPGVPRRTLSFYVKWLRACAAQGHRRRRSQTPREFLASLPDELRADGRAVTAKFESLRYGPGG